ncbi:unnamed protein product [Ceutorhynchus assimilis]|uniref:Serine/threonine-protein phosphatase n=1 Tax=Ceutorhynchus assimilis TaxID=467358 RepID=A0A9N9QNI1_9CUCU|nr:unnamed protein product [Ceutorhynchus assimilis]
MSVQLPSIQTAKLPTDVPNNIISLLIYCVADNSLMLTLDNVNSDHWLPSVKADYNVSWSRLIGKEAQDIVGSKTAVKILRLYKIWYPRKEGDLTLWHCVFQLCVDIPTKNKTKNTMGKWRGKIRWIQEADLLGLLQSNSLRSPELLEFYQLARDVDLNQLNFDLPDDIISSKNISEITDDALVSGKTTLLQQLVEASGIDKLAQEDIFSRVFLSLCFPATYMSLRAFSKFVPEVGWPRQHAQFLFRAADTSNRYAISFREFLYFLAAVDPATGHGGSLAELRCRYMFKYYDRDKDNLLKAEEFKNLITDLRKSKKLPIDQASINKELQETYKALGVQESQSINIGEFMKGICDLKIRGTSHIFRSPTGILKFLKDNSEKLGLSEQAKVTAPVVLSMQVAQQNGKASAKNPDYDIAIHTVKIQRSGHAINIDEMKEVAEAVSLTTIKQSTNEYNKRLSLDIFSQRSVSNEVLKGLRYLTTINNITDAKTSYTWGQLDPVTYAKNLIQVSNQVREIFRGEPRLLELSSPVYILGDFHGNIADLLCFERTLWHIGPGLCPCNLLFLGDYVDRGSFSIEVISYLLSYKLQSPNKVSLLRGNHEIREVQKMFTFYKECCLKLGDKLGNEVWNAVNNAFDTMPIAATIDGKIFCCHGGAPPPWLCPVLSAINEIPVVLSQPDSQSSLAWEIMWNDPVRPKTVNDKLAMELLANEGFAVNTRRGTAHIFSVEALERFLRANQLSHLIRAHEVAQAGFHVQQKGKLLTVFSSSRYCGGNNDAACIMADQGKLRPLRLETDN